VLTEHDLFLLGRRLRQRRRFKGWNQKYLAAQTDIDPGRLSRLERGKAMPKLQELVCLRRVLGGTVDELIFEPEPFAGSQLGGLVRELELEGTEEQIQLVGKLLQAFLIGIRCFAAAAEEGSC